MKLTVHSEVYIEATNAVNEEIKVAKQDHFRAKIENCGDDQKVLFRVIDEILHTKESKP